MVAAKIISCGAYLPKKVLTNDDLSKIIDTSDEWITERTGIKQRHIADESEYTSDLGYNAAIKAIDNTNLNKEEIDAIIVATTTPDHIFPSTATKIQSKLGLKNIFAFDMQAVCSGFVYALTIADNFIRGGQANNILVIGAETLSRIINWKDRNSCVLFGDGAGAVIISRSSDQSGIIKCNLYSDGAQYDILKTTGGPSTSGGAGTITMQGREVFKNAVSKMSSAVENIIKENDLSIDNIDWLIPHQANQRILSAVAKKINISEDKVISTVANHANTSSASIPLALNEALLQNKIKKGDKVVFEALGAGLTWGSVLMQW